MLVYNAERLLLCYLIQVICFSGLLCQLKKKYKVGGLYKGRFEAPPSPTGKNSPGMRERLMTRTKQILREIPYRQKNHAYTFYVRDWYWWKPLKSRGTALGKMVDDWTTHHGKWVTVSTANKTSLIPPINTPRSLARPPSPRNRSDQFSGSENPLPLWEPLISVRPHARLPPNFQLRLH